MACCAAPVFDWVRWIPSHYEMLTPPEVEIPITIDIKAISPNGEWEVVDVVDDRDGSSLGDVGIYSFDDTSDFMEDLERAVLETLLENEGFDPTASYSLSISVRNGGNEIGAATRYFPGHTVPRPPQNWRAARLWPTVAQYLPYLDSSERSIESGKDYVRRMQTTVLPYWPEGPLLEWLYRHYQCIETYEFLGFDTFQFELQNWDLADIPVADAFADPKYFDSLTSSFEHWVTKGEWLARYMSQNGTWNTPICLLENLNGELAYPWGDKLNQPYHLLEGHRRLSFLNALRSSGNALAKHEIWLIRKHVPRRFEGG
jgi:hypothetical protein